MLVAITGYDAVSLQPNAGSQGEFAGLLAIRAYHRSRGETGRNVCLIPSSAHGTNAASAVMAGLKVVVVRCDERGNIDLADLRDEGHRRGRCPGSGHGHLPVDARRVRGSASASCARSCTTHGGQVYVDGANLNALVGLAQPGKFGADVSHLNLHKTFCIPHGGGGPGVGPVAVRAHLAPFLPAHPLASAGQPVGAVSAAPFGSASILSISWVYIALMGASGLADATAMAVLNANYVATRLHPHFPVLYTGENGRVAHECIVDLRPITKATGVTVDDVAKRLIDYGLPRAHDELPRGGHVDDRTDGERVAVRARSVLRRRCSRSKARSIEVASGKWDVASSPLRHAPHTAEDLIGQWDRPYDRQLGAYPVAALRAAKYFPPVSRIDAAFGDRNLVCSCEPLEALAALSG